MLLLFLSTNQTLNNEKHEKQVQALWPLTAPKVCGSHGAQVESDYHSRVVALACSDDVFLNPMTTMGPAFQSQQFGITAAACFGTNPSSAPFTNFKLLKFTVFRNNYGIDNVVKMPTSPLHPPIRALAASPLPITGEKVRSNLCVCAKPPVHPDHHLFNNDITNVGPC